MLPNSVEIYLPYFIMYGFETTQPQCQQPVGWTASYTYIFEACIYSLACGRLNVSTFEHLLAKRIATFYQKSISSTSTSLKELKLYYFSRCLLAVNLGKFFIEKYSINIDAFDVKTICARIDFVQRNEPRSNYIYVKP